MLRQNPLLGSRIVVKNFLDLWNTDRGDRYDKEDPGVVLTSVVSSCLRHQAVTVCDEAQEACG